MSLRLAAVALIALSFAAAPLAAQQPTTPKTSEDRIASLESELAALRKRMDATDTKIDGVKTDLEKQLTSLAKSVTALSELIRDQNTSVESLTKAANTFSTRVNDQLGIHERILTDVARQDGDRYVPQLSAAMAKDSFRQEMGAAVHATLKTQGQFRVVNKTASQQSIAVNLVEYVLQPGEERILEVPVGTVTTQLPGEPLVNWTLTHAGGGVYAESIDIVPKTTVRRVIYADAALPVVTYLP